MYLMISHVPIHVDGPKRFVSAEWRRSLVLLRNSLEDRFGPIAVLAPCLPADSSESSQALEELTERADGIQLIASFDASARSQDFWLYQRKNCLCDVRQWIARAEVVHGNMDDDVYRPVAFSGFAEAARQGRPTVFARDIDQVSMIKGVRLADLSLLKGGTLYRRYADYARNPRAFHETSYLLTEVLEESSLERRIASLDKERPLRLVYCGGFQARKGIPESVHIMHLARKRGAPVELDIIGDGPERASLEEEVSGLGLTGSVRFLGSVGQGPKLRSTLATYDSIFFTPIAEDTPDMVFDGYAAGLPTIGYGIDYLVDRQNDDGAALTFPLREREAGARILCDLAVNRHKIASLAREALKAARFHAADEGYRRRAEWTIDMVDARVSTSASGRRPLEAVKA